MDEIRMSTAIELFERMLGKPVPKDIAHTLQQETDELNLVRSGLDDTMRHAFREIRNIWRSRSDVPDLRTAAYIAAIKKVAHYYLEYALQ